MHVNAILVNDTVRIKVKFDAEPSSVSVSILKSDNTQIISTSATMLTASEYYYDFTPTLPDTYKIVFIGVIPGGTFITVNQQLYVSTPTDEYKPVITLKSDEIVNFAADVDPLFLNPEELKAYYPEASLLEIGELVHYYSSEVKELYGFNDSNPSSGINFISLEYIKAATACALSKTYSYGGDDDMSVQLGDLTVTARNFPRASINRGNAVTWCQLAAAYRKEMLAGKTGPRGMQPKGLPSLPIVNSRNYIDLDNGSSRTTGLINDPMPKRGLRNHD